MSFKISAYADWHAGLQTYINGATASLSIVANQSQVIIDDNATIWQPVNITNWNIIPMLPAANWSTTVFEPATEKPFIDSIVPLYGLVNLKYANQITDPLCPPMPTETYVFGNPASAGCITLFNSYFNENLPEYNSMVSFYTTTRPVSGVQTLLGSVTVYNSVVTNLNTYLSNTIVTQTVAAINNMAIKCTTPTDRILYILLKKPYMNSTDVDIEDVLMNTYHVKDVLDAFGWVIQGVYP